MSWITETLNNRNYYHLNGKKYSNVKLIRSTDWSTIKEIKKSPKRLTRISPYSIYQHSVNFNRRPTINEKQDRLTWKLFRSSFRLGYHYRAKILTWLIATLGLILQIYQVSVIYFEYPTRVDIDIDLPRNITMPALTVCLELESQSNLWKSEYLSMESKSSNGSWDIRDFYRYLPGFILDGIHVVQVKVICQTPFPELIKINPIGSTNCENYSPIRKSLHYNWETNRVHRCTTYYYRRYQSKPIEVITADAKDFFQLSFLTTGNYSIGIIVHNPFEILHFIEADTFHFWTQQTDQMILVTTKVTTHLLRSPYRTDCVDYDHLEFGRTSCINSCQVRKVQSDCPIWPGDVPMTTIRNESFSILGKSCRHPERYFCRQKSICKAQCTHRWYTTTLISSKEKRSHSNVTNLFVRRPFGAELVYKYGPRLTRIEFICYVASCFGIWFGISVTDIFLFTFHQSRKHCFNKSTIKSLIDQSNCITISKQ